MDTTIHSISFAHSKGRNLPIEVIHLSELRTRKLEKSIYEPKRPDFYVSMFVTDGRGAHWVDFIRHELTPGTVLQVRPDQIHAFDADSHHEALLLVFRPEIVPESQVVRLAVHLSQPVQLQPDDFALLVPILELLEQIEQRSTPFHSTAMATGLLQAVLAGLDDMYAQGQIRSAPPARQRAMELVHRFEELLLLSNHRTSLEECARQLHVTTRTLSRACRQIRGATPKELIDRNLALEARRKLILGHQTVEEIGYDLGFSEATNFVKFFKRIEGDTPEAFRRRQRSEKGLVRF